MNNVINFVQSRNSKEEVREEAGAWLARIDSGLSRTEKKSLQAWISEDPGHAEMLFEIAVLWDQLSILSELSDIFPLENYRKPPLLSFIKTKLFAAAASILVFCLLALSMNGLVNTGEAEDQEYSLQAYETEIGEQQTITLPDNSEIILNTNTQLEIMFSDNERRIILNRGEGLFTVAKDESRPFKVYAGSHVVEAIGTAFTVQKKDEDHVEILVTEGRVNFSKLSASIEASAIRSFSEFTLPAETSQMSVTAGEFAASDIVDIGVLEKVNVEPGEIEVRLAWQNGMLLFQGDPLVRVLEEVSRYTTIRIEADESIEEILVQGYFRAGDVDGLLVAMERNFQIRAVRVSDDYIRLSSNNN